MMIPLSLIDVIDRVWSTARDGRWHLVGELASQLVLSTQDVKTALSFLLKYGFAEMIMGPVIWVRLNPLAPSPGAIAGTLSDLVAEDTYGPD